MGFNKLCHLAAAPNRETARFAKTGLGTKALRPFVPAGLGDGYGLVA